MTQLALLAAVSTVLLPAPIWAATASGSAAASVVSPITIRQIADLDFGTVTSTAAGFGSVTLAPGQGAAAFSGGTTSGCSNTGECPAPHPASFVVRGDAGRAYAVFAPPSVEIRGTAILPPLDSARDLSMPLLRIENLRIRTASRPQEGPAGQLDHHGSDSFDLGGTLRVRGGLAPARYRISVPIVVVYS